jgi:hypothetical protein
MDFWDLFPVLAPIVYWSTVWVGRLWKLKRSKMQASQTESRDTVAADTEAPVSSFHAQIGRYRLPVFTEPKTSSPAGRKLDAGSIHSAFSIYTDGAGNEWWQLDSDRSKTWIVAVSEGVHYASRTSEAPPVSPDDPTAPWRAELLKEQLGQSWVPGMMVEARSSVDPRASELQRATAENIIGLIGILERPSGSNRGPALSGLVGEYVEHHRISPDKDGTGLAWCALVAQWAQAEAMYLPWADPSGWSEHPLRNWWGAAWMQEREAKRYGVWTPCASLTGSECITGAMLVQIRSGSGSDSASGGIRADGSYAGHVDVVLGWKGKDHVVCVGGNLGNTAKLVVRNIREARCRGIVPVVG